MKGMHNFSIAVLTVYHEVIFCKFWNPIDFILAQNFNYHFGIVSASYFKSEKRRQDIVLQENERGLTVAGFLAKPHV